MWSILIAVTRYQFLSYSRIFLQCASIPTESNFKEQIAADFSEPKAMYIASESIKVMTSTLYFPTCSSIKNRIYWTFITNYWCFKIMLFWYFSSHSLQDVKISTIERFSSFNFLQTTFLDLMELTANFGL